MPVEIVLAWLAFGVGAAVYARARRAAARRSPPRPPLDSLLTATFRAGVGIDGWSTGDGHGDELLLDARHLVLELGRQRAVVERSAVLVLLDRGLLGWEVVHSGAQQLTFSLPRREVAGFVVQARRLGWPLSTSR